MHIDIVCALKNIFFILSSIETWEIFFYEKNNLGLESYKYIFIHHSKTFLDFRISIQVTLLLLLLLLLLVVVFLFKTFNRSSIYLQADSGTLL